MPALTAWAGAARGAGGYDVGAMRDVVIYTTATCPYCRRAEHFLSTKGIPFTQIDVTDDDEARAALVEKAEGRKTVPQIFIGGKAIGGYTDMVALDARGELATLLADGGAPPAGS